LYVIDGSVEGDFGENPNSKSGERSPMADYLILRNELKHYNNGALLNKPSLIVRFIKKSLCSSLINIFLK
jgi:hypothetical protein